MHMDGAKSESNTIKETRKQRKQVNIPLSEVKPLGKQTNNDSSAHMKGGEAV